MPRYVGGIIRKEGIVPSGSSASGVWTITDYTRYLKSSQWPLPVPPSLYTFTDATFTPGAATGPIGPSLAQAVAGLTGTGVDAWKNNTAYFNTTSGIQLWTVPATGTYRIEAFGSQGATNTAAGHAGGFGARMRGDFSLVQGEIIRILVGQRLNFSDSCGGGGGGGGSFVVRSPYNTTGSILVIAGGGGGGGKGANAPSGGTTSNNGNAGAGSPAGAGGTGGTGGGIPTVGCSGPEGSGGGGFTGNGTTNATGSVGGSAFINGGAGGNASGAKDGGFGGGGGTQNYGGSGGGGYSGGGGGGLGGACTCGTMNGGGGGGSYNAGTNQSNTSAARSDQGQVIITKL
jgi:hypothetical protein